MWRGEISAARGIEQIFDSVEVKKESVAASTGEERIGAGLDDVGFGAERDLGAGDDFRSDSFDGLSVITSGSVPSLSIAAMASSRV